MSVFRPRSFSSSASGPRLAHDVGRVLRCHWPQVQGHPLRRPAVVFGEPHRHHVGRFLRSVMRRASHLRCVAAYTGSLPSIRPNRRSRVACLGDEMRRTRMLALGVTGSRAGWWGSYYYCRRGIVAGVLSAGSSGPLYGGMMDLDRNVGRYHERGRWLGKALGFSSVAAVLALLAPAAAGAAQVEFSAGPPTWHSSIPINHVGLGGGG